jgi:cyclic pyranopterin phosphate synthase
MPDPTSSPRLTHLSSSGEVAMVDVSQKAPVLREAVAEGFLHLASFTLDLIETDQVAKGNVLATARIAGIMAAKRTGELIPLCHPLPISHCEIQFEVAPGRDRIRIVATTRIVAATGVEMEALTAVAVAGLTIYDMCKAADKGMHLEGVRLIRKTKGLPSTG